MTARDPALAECGTKTSLADTLIRDLRCALQDLDEMCTPSEQDAIYSALLAHIRGRRPESVSPLGTLPAPTEVIRDPRGQS